MDFGLYRSFKGCVRNPYFSIKTRVTSKSRLIISLCSLVFLSQRAFELINCQNPINVNDSFSQVKHKTTYESKINIHENLIKNHRMNPDEVPKFSLQSMADDIRGHQNDITFNVDFLEQPDQFEAGQSFFMASQQVPRLVPIHRQPANRSRWSVAINRPEHAQQDAIRMTQEQPNFQLTTPPPALLPTTMTTSETANESSSNQTNTSLIEFDDENDLKNQTINRLADELERLKETERLLEKSLIEQRQIIRPKLINEINKQLTSHSHSPISPTSHVQDTNFKNYQDPLVLLRQTEESMRGVLPKLNYVQHPKGNNKSKINKLSSLLKPSSNNERKTIVSLHAQPTTTLPVVQMNPNAREGSMSGYHSIEDNQNKRHFQMTSPPMVGTNNNKNHYEPQRKNDARFDRYPIDSFQNKQYQAYLKYVKSLDGSNINFRLPKVSHHKVWPNIYGLEHNSRKNKLQGSFPITEFNENSDNSLVTATHQEDLSPPLTSINSDDISPAIYEGDIRDMNEYPTNHENRLPAASSHFQSESHDFVPATSQFGIKSSHSMRMPNDIYPWPSWSSSVHSTSFRPRRYPSPPRYHHSSAAHLDYRVTSSPGEHHMPMSSARHRDYNYNEHRMAVGPSYHRAYKVRPIYESEEHHDLGGSHSHKVIHIHTKEKKKYGKYLWPILGGGLTMLMGFLIISNMLLSIPLLAIGASSLFNHGGFHSQQLVPVYNLSQLQPPRASGRRRRRWADKNQAEVDDRLARLLQPRELLKRILFSLSRSNRCRVATF